MRLIATLGVLLLATMTAGLAQPGAGPDGFAICPFKDMEIDNCEPLTEATAQRYRLTPAETGIVALLRRYTATLNDALIDEIEKSFAPQRPVAAPGQYADFWLPERSASGEPDHDCLICGLHLRSSESVLRQISYAVKGRFAIIWSRAATSDPPR